MLGCSWSQVPEMLWKVLSHHITSEEETMVRVKHIHSQQVADKCSQATTSRFFKIRSSLSQLIMKVTGFTLLPTIQPEAVFYT